MRRRLPPLNALRAFEAAARHESFKAAADELAVTPAAIGHQIRTLEDVLGVELFRRMNRAVEPTDKARRLLPELTKAFDIMAEAIADLAKVEDGGVIAASVVPSFAVKWLIPRLDRFNRAHPELDVRISASYELADFRRDGIDCGIRFGRGEYPGLKVWKLLDDAVLPAISPDLLRDSARIERPADLANLTLIHDDSLRYEPMTPDWRAWLAAVGAEEAIDWRRGPHFSHADHALQAAIDGVGVVLTRRSLAANDIEAGRLLPLFEREQPISMSYWLVCPPDRAERPHIRTFIDWILEEAASQSTGWGSAESRVVSYRSSTA